MIEQTNLLAKRLIPSVMELYQHAISSERQYEDQLARVDPVYQYSARNLIHYLAVRRSDIRQLQNDLAYLGLTSLGGMESFTLFALERVLQALHALAGERWEPDDILAAPPANYRTGRMFLDDHTYQLFGAAAGKRSVRIMVTMPSEAATDPKLIQNLLAAGMDVMRINCAHDDVSAWESMVRNLRQAEAALGRPCKVYADLAGPKLRTGRIAPAGNIVKYRPARDVRGIVQLPARLWLTSADNPQPAPDADLITLTFTGPLLQDAQIGDQLRFRDARGRKRRLDITWVAANSCMAQGDRTGYVEDGLPIELVREAEVVAAAAFSGLPEMIVPLTLVRGDQLILTPDHIPGGPARTDEQGNVLEPAHVPCTLTEAFDSVKPGDRVWLDDGQIGGRVQSNDGQHITLVIDHAAPDGSKLRPEKGINLPNTDLHIKALTSKDIEDIGFVARHADLVGLSFVREVDDVFLLEEQLERHGNKQPGIVLKIENRRAFDNLPNLLLAAMHKPPDGIMLARGDLASEIGFEQLAEVQEEILSLCEAAHMPVIWATQVLESLAKRGTPSRAEVSDAVMSARAECVMLNKGPYIVEAVRFLNGVLERMETHRAKRRTMLRQLTIPNET